MHHGSDTDEIIAQDIVNAVRKPVQQRSSRCTPHNAMLLGEQFDDTKHMRGLCQEFTAKTGALHFVPRVCLTQVVLGFRRKKEIARHQPRRCSISSRTTRQGRPRYGSARCRASRRSSSAACPEVSGISSGVKLSHSFSTSSNRSAGVSDVIFTFEVLMNEISVKRVCSAMRRTSRTEEWSRAPSCVITCKSRFPSKNRILTDRFPRAARSHPSDSHLSHLRGCT
jgi:hypothetical protein